MPHFIASFSDHCRRFHAECARRHAVYPQHGQIGRQKTEAVGNAVKKRLKFPGNYSEFLFAFPQPLFYPFPFAHIADYSQHMGFTGNIYPGHAHIAVEQGTVRSLIDPIEALSLTFKGDLHQPGRLFQRRFAVGLEQRCLQPRSGSDYIFSPTPEHPHGGGIAINASPFLQDNDCVIRRIENCTAHAVRTGNSHFPTTLVVINHPHASPVMSGVHL
jgi:hypothetical protein